MTKQAYLECPTGLAGDMCLGALVHAGVPLEYLVEQLKLLGISDEYHLWAEKVQRNGQQATKVHVDLLAAPHLSSSEAGVDPHNTFTTHLHPDKSDYSSGAAALSHSHAHEISTVESTEIEHSHSRHLPEIVQMIQAAGLPPQAEAWSLAVFQRLAEAEGAVHGIAPDQVHFHEVGATDAIVDIVGTCLGLDWLGVDQIYCSAMPTGGGTIRAAHGRLPVPAPAVLKLWEMRQVPIYSNGIERELVTPTGAAIATTLATAFGAPPPMRLQTVGLGAGSRQLPIPNMVRLWIGEGENRDEGVRESGSEGVRKWGSEGVRKDEGVGTQAMMEKKKATREQEDIQENITVLETQIDDLNPQAIGYVFEALLAAGAVDVFTQAIAMKKSRSGILLSVVCHPNQVKACETIIFRETTTLGIRRLTQQRTILQRELQTVQTVYGAVQVKIAWHQGAIANVQPEYQDCAAIATRLNIPWREVHQVTLQTWYAQQNFSEPSAATADERAV